MWCEPWCSAPPRTQGRRVGVTRPVLGFTWHLALLVMETRPHVSSAPARVTKDSVRQVCAAGARADAESQEAAPGRTLGQSWGVCWWLESQGRAGSRGKSR